MDESHLRSLEQLFNQTSKPTVPQKEQIARMLNLPIVVVQTWFNERRARAKEDKLLEEAQARAALESASRTPTTDYASENLSTRRPKTYRTQSEASYASLARSLKAAAAASIPSAAQYDRTVSPEYSYNVSPQSYSPTSTSFDMASSSMTRNESQWSNLSTPVEIPDFANYPWSQSCYMPTAQAIQSTMVYEEPAQSDVRPVEMPTGPVARPRMQRTWTAPETFVRPPAYRSVSMPLAKENIMPESMPIRRRPKLSPLGVGMARSRSSLGYENEPYSITRRTPVSSDFPYPLTPVRRIASSTAVPTLSGLKSHTSPLESSSSSIGANYNINKQELAMDADMSFSMQFPPSPISPEHNLSQQSLHTPGYNFAPLVENPVLEDVFTPPQTPLTALSSNTENILANSQDKLWMNNAFQMSENDFMPNELALGDIFSEEMMALETY